VTSDANALQLIDHRVDRVLERERLAARFDRDLLGKISLGDRGGHRGNVSHLAGEISSERVDVVGQVLPRAGDARHLCLSTQLALGSHFARDARDFVGEGAELVDHCVDGGADSKELALHRLAIDLQHHLLAEIPLGYRGQHASYFGRGRSEVGDERID